MITVNVILVDKTTPGFALFNSISINGKIKSLNVKQKRKRRCII